MITIRPATTDDAETLAAMRWDFRSARASPSEDRGAFLARCAAWMRHELGEAGSWRAWLAIDDAGQVVGHVWMRAIRKIPNPVGDLENLGYLSNLFVLPQSRGGVGSELLRTALDWARASGVDTVMLWPTPRSRTLYQRHGFTDHVEFFALKLGPPLH